MQNRRIATFNVIEDLVRGLRAETDNYTVTIFWDLGEDNVHISALAGDSMLLVCDLSPTLFDIWRESSRSDGISLFSGRVEFAP